MEIRHRDRLGREDFKGRDSRAAELGFKVVATKPDVSAFKRELLEQIGEALIDTPDEQLRASDDETPKEAARRFIASRRVLNEWDKAIGPFYDTASLMSWLQQKHRMNLKHKVDRREILAVKAGRTLLYPTFQFSRSGQPLPGLHRVLEVLGAYITDPWDQALWLVSPLAGVAADKNVTAAVLLREGRVEDVVRMAAEDFIRWQQ